MNICKITCLSVCLRNVYFIHNSAIETIKMQLLYIFAIYLEISYIILFLNLKTFQNILKVFILGMWQNAYLQS